MPYYWTDLQSQLVNPPDNVKEIIVWSKGVGRRLESILRLWKGWLRCDGREISSTWSKRHRWTSPAHSYLNHPDDSKQGWVPRGLWRTSESWPDWSVSPRVRHPQTVRRRGPFPDASVSWHACSWRGIPDLHCLCSYHWDSNIPKADSPLPGSCLGSRINSSFRDPGLWCWGSCASVEPHTLGRGFCSVSDLNVVWRCTLSNKATLISKKLKCDKRWRWGDGDRSHKVEVGHSSSERNY